MLQSDQWLWQEKLLFCSRKMGASTTTFMWYELAYDESCFRHGDFGRALEKFIAVEKHYADITGDQFDFHSYCLRKMTPHAYVGKLKFKDWLHSHSYFHKVAAGAIR
ncbi:N-terminal acetyltransferase A complex auxiliary subunit NAA15-like isoform X2 [Durio zibethinus]|nr:N-terminal acetyltransferase A complex auxiliary subunit NAA15-like isoform X2 [Durio zibethinus]